MTSVISIRGETTDDHEQIRLLTMAAFSNSEFGYNGESELIDALRAKSDKQLSLVACSDDELVGHILFTRVTIRTPQEEMQGMGLAPMSVAPQHQRTGIGSSLVTNGLNRLFHKGCPFVVVLGHPDYYVQFGFRPASQFGISHRFSGIPQNVFFIQSGPGGTLTSMSGGTVYYQPEFGLQDDGT